MLVMRGLGVLGRIWRHSNDSITTLFRNGKKWEMCQVYQWFCYLVISHLMSSGCQDGVLQSDLRCWVNKHLLEERTADIILPAPSFDDCFSGKTVMAI